MTTQRIFQMLLLPIFSLIIGSLYAQVTPEGSRAAQLPKDNRIVIGRELMAGKKDISVYDKGICHDVVAYTKYMLGANITPTELAKITGNEWLTKFNYTAGAKWDGKSVIPEGKAVGFFRVLDKKFFHSALSIGGNSVRSVNGFRLGSVWLVPVNLTTVLGKPNADGTFNYDGTKIIVYISDL